MFIFANKPHYMVMETFLNPDRSVQEGGGVEPPLSTVLGMVGMMICFDVSIPSLARFIL
jgi:predicted amidohydrolase